MHKTRNTEEPVVRRQLLEDQLYQAMLEKPYSEISVSDLCQQAGISRKSFYRYFGNKDGCLSALLDRVLLNTVSYQGKINYAAGSRSPELLQIMEYWMEQKSLLDLITANDLQSKLLERCFLHVVNEERDALRWLGISDIAKEPEAAIFGVTGFIAVLLSWSRNGFPRSPEEMAQIFTRIWTQPLMKLPQEL